MSLTRRHFTAAAAAGITIMPFAARAAGDVFTASGGDVTVHPVAHASFVMEAPAGVIHVDPVGGGALYAGFPPPDLILITHQHADHMDAETLDALVGDETRLIVNPAVMELLSADMQARAEAIGNGDETRFGPLGIRAIPAYNTTPERQQFHPEGRDNGYILGFDGLTVYISGDTEDTPEMRALTGIDIAFICMNLPFTMDAQAAADAVAAFRPKVVYPYHYRGRDGGTQDPAAFAALVGDAAEVRLARWYE